ncbi:Glycosyltransferase involved in cell wall bisynthesis [Clostridium amylolyticum]|uniref:Glycosyltransferase involved in cell wall bisynthesis n=1 Tax=Clostridium amylolyticum TaxID=1121298 RepID=A0A1M6M8L4_9CLOT|nr:glycosyltransferase [Clostridium amylolyticum]SHJ79791.1 Glycosyltransferase involved in cell wall bisynthesis [Clostridium amylolyticum]
MKKVLLISPDIVAKKMAGPGIRYFNFAKELSTTLEVTLFIPNKETDMDFSKFNFKVIKADKTKLKSVAKDVHSIVMQGIALRLYPFLKRINKPIVVDIYDPITLENLELRKNLSLSNRIEYHETDLDLILEQLGKGDFFLCASEKQKDYWMGMLAALNRVNPATYIADVNMKKLIGVVPFGLNNEAPVKTKNVLKGVWENITKEDKVIIWGGGIWNWFDPLTLIEAMYIISTKRSDIKLFFMGIGHPTVKMDISTAQECIDLSKKYDLFDKNIFFNDWVPYEERQNYLMEADLGISTYFNNLETRYSFRTRILDYLWCDLPMVLTKGDFMAEMVERENIGSCHEERDAAGLAEAIVKLLDDKELYKECEENIESLKEAYKWKNAVKDLRAFCENPYISQDKKLKVKIFYKDGIAKKVKYYYVRVKNKLKKILKR